MTRLLLIRHGSTAWNAERRYQGQTDIPLSDDGRDQVKRLAQRLSTERIDAVYASDLRRAWETSKEIAASHGLTVRPDPRLREICFGQWEGKTREQIEADDAERLARWFASPMDNSPPGGETLRAVVKRVGAAYQSIANCHPEETVAIVAHGGTLRVLVCLALKLSPHNYWRFRFDRASLSQLIARDDGAILSSLNDVAHLRSWEGLSPGSWESSSGSPQGEI
jgi:alpha-ribazole phosphatase